MSYEVKPGDIAIILHPVTREGEWTGHIKTGLIFGEAETHEGMKGRHWKKLLLWQQHRSF